MVPYFIPVQKLPEHVRLAIEHVRQTIGEDGAIILFGSRAAKHSKRNVDFDIGIATRKPLPWKTFARLKSDVEEIAWPYRIDLVDLRQAPAEFLEVVAARFVVLQGEASEIDRITEKAHRREKKSRRIAQTA